MLPLEISEAAWLSIWSNLESLNKHVLITIKQFLAFVYDYPTPDLGNYDQHL